MKDIEQEDGDLEDIEQNKRNNDPEGAEQPPEIDQHKLEEFIQKVKDNQNFAAGLIGGTVAALVGAGVWAGITAATGRQFGIMAIGIGFIVGFAVRFTGRGIDTIYGIIGATLSLLSCLAGNLLAILQIGANEHNVSFWSLVGKLDPQSTMKLMQSTFHPMDVIFYGIAIYFGYKVSFRQIKEEELGQLVQTDTE